MRRFLVTGLPRIRSAWLAALFSSDDVRCFHDATHHGSIESMLTAVERSTKPIVGLFDPCASFVYPMQALRMFENSPIVMVRRDAIQSKQGLERWSGQEWTGFEQAIMAAQAFADSIADRLTWVDFNDLDSFEVVSGIYYVCTGLSLDKDRFDLFNTLKIEQHFAKAQRAGQLFRH